MDEAILTKDITSYIQRRRAFLMARRDAVEIPVEKGKVIGMLQALSDFEGMICQLRVKPVTFISSIPAFQAFQGSCNDLAAQWLSAMDLSGVCLDDLRDNKRQNRAIALHPEKREHIIALGQLIRNHSLVDEMLDHLRSRDKRKCEALEMVREKNGGTCPYCGKSYKYEKALITHIATCPQGQTAKH